MVKKIEEVKKEITKEEEEDFRLQLITGRRPVLVPLHKEREFSVRMPTPEEQQIALRKKASYFQELRKDPTLKTQSQLDGELDKEGVYTQKDNDNLTKLQEEYKQKQKELAPVGDNEKEKIQKIKGELESIKGKIQEIVMKKAVYYANSVEVLSLTYEQHVLTSMCSEKKMKGEWCSVWNSYEEYAHDTDSFLTQGMFDSFVLLSGEGIGEDFFGLLPKGSIGDLDTLKREMEALSSKSQQQNGTKTN